MKIFIIYIKNEIKQFQEYFFLCSHANHQSKTEILVYLFDPWKWFDKNVLIDVFPNLYIALKSYYTQVQTVQLKELFQNSIESRTITYQP